MSKTDFSKKCEILGDLWEKHVLISKDVDSMTEEWKYFFANNAVILPLAYIESRRYASIEERSEYNIEDLWEDFCELLNVDPKLGYSSLDKILNKSSNAPR